MNRSIILSFFALFSALTAEEAPVMPPANAMLDARLGRIEGQLAIINGHLTKSAMPRQDAEFQLRVRVHDDDKLSILGRAITEKEFENTLSSLQPLFIRGRVLVVTESDPNWERIKFVHDTVKRIMPNAAVAFTPNTIKAEQVVPPTGP